MKLPDKAQKIHFSEEEQLLLAGRYQTIFPDTADVVVYNLGHQKNQSIPSLRTFSDSSQSSAFSLEEESLVDADDMDDPTLDSFRWMEDEDELDLSLDCYHTHLSSITQSPKKPSPRRPSFRRSLSLTSMPFGGAKFSSNNKVSVNPKPIEPSPMLPLLSHQRKNSHLHQGSVQPTPLSQQPISTVESPTKYYQDPEARLKLRIYLASPQKFDEALEFGFPSLEDKENIPLSRPSLSKHHLTDSALRTFFNDDSPSIFSALDDDDDDDPNSPDTSQHKTPPTSGFHRPYRVFPSKQASLEPDISRRTCDPYGNSLAGAREMTLRMTLTRPDLRKTDPPLHENNDPLALQNLPPVQNPHDIWETQSKDSIVKKLWQKMSRKSPMA